MHFRNLGVADDERDAISPLGRPRSANGDSNFPLRKTGIIVISSGLWKHPRIFSSATSAVMNIRVVIYNQNLVY